uniref:Uncharacterized protein n=1 Tax=Rhizophora mucronata TaxID=61149 RepID=A0A2P2QG80_RHIMU
MSEYFFCLLYFVLLYKFWLLSFHLVGSQKTR